MPGAWPIVASGDSSLQAALCRASGSVLLQAASGGTQPGFWSSDAFVALGNSVLLVVSQVVTRYFLAGVIATMWESVLFHSLTAGSGRND